MRKFKLLLIGILFCSFSVFAQQTVKGVVKEKSSGDGLPGVSIIVQGTKKGAETDFDGNFSLANVKSGDVLIFTYLGYKTQRVTLANNFNITIELEESAEQLDEVVVVGYGTTTVKDATGSVESITAKEFTKGNIVTPENLLSGRVAGVSINTSGAPGSGSQIRIRGGSSLTASNSPLIVIDGLPISNNNTAGTRSILSSINPADIESFSVLKDASATAIYGSRAANGVIIIVTKKGKSDFTLDYDFQFSSGEFVDRIDVYSGDEFRQLVNSQPISGVTLDPSLLGNANTDWQDEILQTAVSTQHNITANGSIFNTIPTRLSVGFSEIQAAVLTSQFDRANVSLSMNPSLFDDHLKISLNYNRGFENSRFAAGGIGAALRYDPTQPVRASGPFGGYYQHFNNNGGRFVLLNGGTNPLASILQNNNTGESFRQFGNLKFDYKFHFLPELRLVTNLGYDRTEGSYNSVGSALGPRSWNSAFSGNNSFGFQNRQNQLVDAYLNYNKEFKNIKTDFTIGYSYQKFSGNGFNSGNLRNPNDNGRDTFRDTDEVLIGFFGRANLTFLEKYLLTFTYRRDGTSKFGPNNRWGDFPSVAVGWRVSDEDFLKDSKVISNLKLRASYGITGQQDISNPEIYLETYRFGNQGSGFLFGGNPIQSTIPQPFNPDIKWEDTASLEFGLDYGLFDNKFSGSINVYQKNSTDLLFGSPVADGTNFTNNIIKNIGEFQTRGLEFSLNADVLNNEDLNWNFNFNAAYVDRQVKSLPLGIDIETGGITGGTGSNIQVHSEGFAPFSFYVFKQLYDANGSPIEGAYADINGDGIVSASDRYIKEDGDADVTLGFQSNFNYKNFDFSFNLRASLGNYVYNNVQSTTAQYDLIQDQSVLANIPRSVENYNFNTTASVLQSDIYVENASFLRMDNITLGYTFDRPIKKFSKNSVRLWAGVQNAFVITNYSGLDPEVFNGIDNLVFPRARTFLLGANIKF